MAIKRGKMVTYLEGLLTIKSLSALITWSCEIKKLKALYILYHSAYDHQTWQDDNLPEGAPNV